MPTASDDVVHVAVPPEIVALVQPEIEVPPSWKVTMPVGEAPEPLTVAVIVTVVPTMVGDVGDAESAIEASDFGAFTVCVTTADVFDAYVVSPEYAAVSEWLPVESEVVEHDAVPDARVSAEHPAIVVPPSLTLTVPVGVPDPPLTVTESVTAWPATDGFGLGASDTVALASVAVFTVCVRALEVAAL